MAHDDNVAASNWWFVANDERMASETIHLFSRN